MTSKGSILVVDDSPANLQLLEAMLSSEGYNVQLLTDGIQAANIARLHRPDVLLLDIMLPDMDGFEICTSFKNDESLRDIPIIFVSARSDTLDKMKAFEVGGVDYITKPFRSEEVLARVGTHVTLHRQRKQIEYFYARDQLYIKRLSDFIEEAMSQASHDLRNPLMSINLAVRVLEKRGRIDDDQGMRLLNSIREESNRMLALIKDLLELARIDFPKD